MVVLSDKDRGTQFGCMSAIGQYKTESALYHPLSQGNGRECSSVVAVTAREVTKCIPQTQLMPEEK